MTRRLEYQFESTYLFIERLMTCKDVYLFAMDICVLPDWNFNLGYIVCQSVFLLHREE